MNDNRHPDHPDSPSRPAGPPVYYSAYPPPVFRDNGDDEIRLADLWRGLVSYRYFIAIVAIASVGISLVFAYSMTPVYRAEILLAPIEDNETRVMHQYDGLADLAGINLGGGNASSARAIATLESRALTDAFITQENIMPILFADRWDAEAQQWRHDAVEPTRWDANGQFKRNVRSVGKNVRQGLVALEVEWKDPELAAQWANRLVEYVNSKMRAEAIREAETSINYLNEQLQETSIVELQQAIYRLIEAQTKKIMIARSRVEYAFKVIDPAVAPQESIRPKQLPIAILGLFVGLAISMFIAMVRYRSRSLPPDNE